MNIFEKGNKITTNRRNCFLIIDVNESQISCKDLLTGDFDIFDKTEHEFEIFDVKLSLTIAIEDILDETDISTEDRKHILDGMLCRINKWIE